MMLFDPTENIDLRLIIFNFIVPNLDRSKFQTIKHCFLGIIRNIKENFELKKLTIEYFGLKDEDFTALTTAIFSNSAEKIELRELCLQRLSMTLESNMQTIVTFQEIASREEKNDSLSYMAKFILRLKNIDSIKSMSLLSSWKTLISLPQEKTLQFENIVLNNPAFSQAQSDMQNKILRALQILKERSSRTASDSISRVFYEKIAQIPLSFFTSKNMPNLAETDGVSKIFINEECFKDEKVLFFEIFHELVHISKMDKIENNEIATETNNYLYVMTMLCEMFGPAEAESYITALAGTRLFNVYNVQEMREFFESRLGAIPADLQNALSSRDTQLSYPIILRHILDIAQRVHANKDTADGLFKNIVLLDREQGTQDIVSAVKAYMTITVNA